MQRKHNYAIAIAALFAGIHAGAALAEDKWLPPHEIAPTSAANTSAPAPAAREAAPVATATAGVSKAAVVDDKKATKAKDCSAQADAKGLHGKERKKFKEECKKS